MRLCSSGMRGDAGHCSDGMKRCSSGKRLCRSMRLFRGGMKWEGGARKRGKRAYPHLALENGRALPGIGHHSPGPQGKVREGRG